MKVEHPETCDLMCDFLQKMMRNSKFLATAGERDRTLFFNKIHITKERIIMDEKMAFL